MVRKMAGIYIILIALILLVSYFSMTSGSFSAKPGELLSTLFRIHPNPQYEQQKGMMAKIKSFFGVRS